MGLPEGSAIVYCEGAFGTSNGKTAHGLVRRTSRYRVLSVIDSHQAGRDAGEILDGKSNQIPIARDVGSAVTLARDSGLTPTHFVIGLAPHGGRLSPADRAQVVQALRAGLNVDSGLHDFLGDDPEIAGIAVSKGLKIRDVRKTPPRSELRAFTGKIVEVEALRVALLGTDAAVGKRTTAWALVEALRNAGYRAEMIGTGQTAWLQGVEFGILLDSLINDFVAGELEHAVLSCWSEKRPHVMVIEGQGGLMSPAYPGGLEILSATQPQAIILQHAPARTEYEGFPGFPMHPIETQVQALELVSGKPVVALSVNHESIPIAEIPAVCSDLRRRVRRPAVDVLTDGASEFVAALRPWLNPLEMNR